MSSFMELEKITSFYELIFILIIIHGHLCEDRSGLDGVITSEADWLLSLYLKKGRTIESSSRLPTMRG